MRECDIGTYHEPPPIGYGYDLPNFSCTICWQLGRSFSTAASPNRQVNACRSLRCAARTCLTLQIQSSGPCGFVHFFWCTRNFGKKHECGKTLLFCHPWKTYTSWLFIILSFFIHLPTPPTKNLLWFPTVSLAPVFVGAFVSLLNKNPSNEFGTFDQLKVGLLVSLLNLTLQPHRIRGVFHHPFSTQDPQFLPWKKTDSKS